MMVYDANSTRRLLLYLKAGTDWNEGLKYAQRTIDMFTK